VSPAQVVEEHPELQGLLERVLVIIRTDDRREVEELLNQLEVFWQDELPAEWRELAGDEEV